MMFSAQPRFAGLAVLCLTAGLPSTSSATEGYFALGYGTAQRGLAGTGVAFSQDAMSGAINPASVASVGHELNFGLELFAPSREFSTGATAMLPANTTVKSGHDLFAIPNFAYNHPLANGAVLNLAVYGNGGMNTSYPNIANANCGPFTGIFCDGKAGVDLTQLFVSTTYAKKTGAFSWGIAPTLAVQSFAARGISSFAAYSSDPAHMTGGKHELSWGLGLRAGIQYDLSPQVTLGLTGQTKFNMSKFDNYAGLFENAGEFDIPAAVALGVALHASPTVTLLADYQKIFYSDVPAVGNTSTTLGLLPLGSAGGPGFGWRDVEVIRIGAEWQHSPSMTWRAGYAHASNPVRSEDAMFNVFAPGVVEDHFSLGGTKRLNERDRLDFSISYVMANTVSGYERTPASTAASTITLKMHQVSAAIGWSRKF
ncbi:OmpP1/FadL family transporter [Rhodobacter maris]|uniref:Long-chain fatty acid transport protein n=1 Tax=Rhodobacter maris TaxID=446682 RepID=A0A285T8N8_9RHOB|nr:outer membrane protein transport protein [Rhodobacter maris]SOC16009.1 long-chain fatty acid transport protein [Rhodobacter maris]